MALSTQHKNLLLAVFEFQYIQTNWLLRPRNEQKVIKYGKKKVLLYNKVSCKINSHEISPYNIDFPTFLSRTGTK